jgi:predicted nucleic acid-binding protein
MTEATAVVADTQILIWYVIDPDRLTPDAVTALENATSAEKPIYVSAHSLVELVYAVEKPNNPLTEDDRQAILDELAREDSPFEVVLRCGPTSRTKSPRSQGLRMQTQLTGSSWQRPRSSLCQSSAATATFPA